MGRIVQSTDIGRAMRSRQRGFFLNPFRFGGGGGGGPIASDSFTGTNGDSLSANWTVVQGAWQIQSNAATPNTGGASAAATWNANTFNNDQYAQCTNLAATGSGNFAGVSVRGSTAAFTMTSIVWDNTDAYVSTWVAGSQTVVAGPIAAPTVGQVVRIEAEGTALRIYYDGVLGSRSYTPANMQSSGRPGIDGYNNSNTVRIDDWSAGNL